MSVSQHQLVIKIALSLIHDIKKYIPDLLGRLIKSQSQGDQELSEVNNVYCESL